MNTPLISVVIPTRHRNDLLAKCLDRLRPGEQTLTADQYEVIVTDDSSTSTAESMIRQSYPWARWTPGPRKGPAANRNHGASLAGGEWIAFTDDDCLPSREWLAAYAAAITDRVDVYEGKTTCEAGLKTPMEQSPGNAIGGWLWSCNMLVRREFFTSFGGFDDDFPYPHMEDVYFRERIKRTGEPFVFVPGAVVDHPPRRRQSGRQWAKAHECEIIYHCKLGETPPSLRSHLALLVRERLRTLFAYPIRTDSVRALCNFGVETVCVMMWYPSWLERHKPQLDAGSTSIRGSQTQRPATNETRSYR